MRKDNGSGYKSTCANEETVDKTGSPRTRELTYELSTKGFGLSGLDWVGFGLGWRPLSAWVAPGVSRARPRAWCMSRLGAGLVLPRSPEQLLAGEEEGREEEGKE